jgi:hypothetical protein
MKGYYWWLAPNGMIGQYRKNPGDGWRGPYDTIRELKEANNNIQPKINRVNKLINHALAEIEKAKK